MSYAAMAISGPSHTQQVRRQTGQAVGEPGAVTPTMGGKQAEQHKAMSQPRPPSGAGTLLCLHEILS
eukprot:17239-Eustigmatos_ZCMA.PRE.1